MKRCNKEKYEPNKPFKNEATVQAQRANPKTRIPIRESQWSIKLREPLPLATDEAIAKGQLSVVLNASFSRPRIRERQFSGNTGPVLELIGEAVVHVEGKDAAMRAPKSGNQKEEVKDRVEETHY